MAMTKKKPAATKKKKPAATKKAKPAAAKKAKPAAAKKAKPAAAKQPAPTATVATASQQRFVLVDPMRLAYSSHARAWKPSGKLANAAGAYLGRLWALFGPPNSESDKGYDYTLLDTERDVLLNAYCGSSGPCYGAFDKPAAAPSISALEALINSTAPVDCAFELGSDYGTLRMGVRNGVAFVETEE